MNGSDTLEKYSTRFCGRMIPLIQAGMQLKHFVVCVEIGIP